LASFIDAGRMQKEEALEERAQSPSEVCVDAVAATVGNHETVERLRSEIEREAPEAHHLLGKAEGRTLVEAPAPEYSWAQLAFMSPVAVEGRANAVRLHGLWGSARSKRQLFPRRLRELRQLKRRDAFYQNASLPQSIRRNV
jgi:hypothetical protein